MKTDDKSTSLEIVPEKHTNIARFLNTANYDNIKIDKKLVKHQNNVSVFKTVVEGKLTVIMHTNREIVAGEEL